MRRSFLNSFWSTFGFVLIAGVLSIVLVWRPTRAGLPPEPTLPLFGDTYISDYYGIGSVSHYLYYFGIFGVGDRLKNSNVLLMGSSHVDSGLSADQLQKDLSDINGRQIHVYNLGLGYAEGIGFDNDIVRSNDLRNKTIIVDLFMPNGEDISSYARFVRGVNTLSAYLHIFQLWTTCLGDWLLDPVLPRFYSGDLGSAKGPGTQMPKRFMGLIAPRRYLKNVDTRSWSTGDSVVEWSSVAGIVSPTTPPDFDLVYGRGQPAYQYMDNIGIFFPRQEQKTFQQFGLKPIYTLLPFEGYRAGQVPADAKPYISIAPEGLRFFEGMHLNPAGRTLATERLFKGMHDQGLAILPVQAGNH